jgi:hypothetical protein
MRNDTKPRTAVAASTILVTSSFLVCEAVSRARSRVTEHFVAQRVTI